MSATTMRADLTGLTIKHAVKLERRSRAGLLRVARTDAFLSLARMLLTPIAKGLAQAVCSNTDRQTMKMADQAVWFQGVRSWIEEGAKMPASDKATGNLLVHLENAQGAVMELREGTLPLVKRFSDYNPQSRVAHSLKRQLVVLADLFDAIEAARWAVMECEADLDIAQGNVKKFDSLDELFASLNA